MEKGPSCMAGKVACLLLVVGGLNWGLVGAGYLAGAGWNGWNVVNLLLGSWPVVEGIVYLLVGLSGVWALVSWKKCCNGMCKK